MGNQIRIEGDEAYAMAAELAGLTSESVDAAVVEAVRLRLEKVRHSQAKTAKVERMLALAATIRAHMQEPVSSDHSWLYDENGLPA